ncbi:MAG: hypothetical protein AAF329_25400 [Cyanobacteria bacterium P01_A01_bin.17]
MIFRTALIGLMLLVGCSSAPTVSSQATTDSSVPAPNQPEAGLAKVTDVTATENQPGQYTFAVTVESPDTGCEQYADWWEVLSEEGELLYRRILAHSHIDEQPFQRSGGPVSVSADQILIVRAHMNPGGYGTQAMKGSIVSGFQETQLAPDFGADVEMKSPQPNACTG